jgi:hypothetical protein
MDGIPEIEKELCYQHRYFFMPLWFWGKPGAVPLSPTSFRILPQRGCRTGRSFPAFTPAAASDAPGELDAPLPESGNTVYGIWGRSEYPVEGKVD